MKRSSRSSSGQPQQLGELVSKLIQDKGLAAKLEAASVVPEWPQLVGPQITAVTEPLRVSEGTLFVAVQSSAWMMELNLMKGSLMRKLNAGKTQGRIEAIRFVMK